MTEEQALAKIISNLQEQGWEPFEVHDGEEWNHVQGMSAEHIVQECAAVDMATLRFIKGENQTGAAALVWGNSPSELIADHTCSHGFDDAVDAALLSIWPTWPNVGD